MEIFLALTITGFLIVSYVDCLQKRRAFLFIENKEGRRK
jgi:hypothetical protein